MISKSVGSVATGFGAFGESWYMYAVYNDVTGSLTNGMPVVLDVTDAAEFNTIFTTTALVSGGNFNLPSGGKVVLATNANGGASPQCVGIFQPSTPSGAPANGDIIRILVYGYGQVAVTGATTVGANLVFTTGSVYASTGAAASKTNIGTVLASRGAVAVGAAPSVTGLVNVFVNPS